MMANSKVNQSMGSSSHLRKVLNVMFPPAYIELYHQPPMSVCSLFNTRCLSLNNTLNEVLLEKPSLRDFSGQETIFEASSEPSSRGYVMNLRHQFDASLLEHQAKQVGLCPVRRAIFDQCFDELIRQVTVGCIEQGLLLFRIRNELRMTLNYYRKAYESGVKFGLNKAIEAELVQREHSAKSELSEIQRSIGEEDGFLERRLLELEHKNKVQSVDRMKEFYTNQLAKTDRIIEQQRAIIKSLSQKSINNIKSLNDEGRADLST